MRKDAVNTKEGKEEAEGCPGTKASVKETRLEQVFLHRPWKSHTEADIHPHWRGGNVLEDPWAVEFSQWSRFILKDWRPWERSMVE